MTEQLSMREQSYGHDVLQGMLGKSVLHFSGGNERRLGMTWYSHCTQYMVGGRKASSRN